MIDQKIQTQPPIKCDDKVMNTLDHILQVILFLSNVLFFCLFKLFSMFIYCLFLICIILSFILTFNLSSVASFYKNVFWQMVYKSMIYSFSRNKCISHQSLFKQQLIQILSCSKMSIYKSFLAFLF